ncbi:MAG TPA: zinc-dependent metalloprotease [Solirubrobacteraceae bacterium]|nr:zinc-dependent metalloprotease [Solirubrobacteraceae bacterium]
MIDWTLAERIAAGVAGTPAGGTELAGDLATVAGQARERVVAYTGLQPGRAIPDPEAVDRREWLRLNLRSMRSTMQPLEDKLRAGGDSPLAGPLRAAGGLLMGAEIGGLTGYLAQRVLGQYELVLLDAASPERLLFVAPNLREAARRLEVDEGDLVTWVGIHEVTHAVQFTSVPWLRAHLAAQLRALLETVDVKVDLAQLPSLDDVRDAVDRFREGGLVTMVAGPERMAILDVVQATMAVVEGHAEHVMDAVGEELLPALPELREALDRRRREKPPAVKLLERLIGLELKMRQYELGRAFCDAVVARGGVETLNRVWAAPEALPTLLELEDPDGWIERTAAPSLPRA